MKAVDTFENFYNVVGPIMDVLVIAFILYKAYEVLIKTNGIQIVKTSIIIALVYVFALFLRLNTVMWILNSLAPGILIAFAIVFQQELRRIFLHLGQGSWLAISARSKDTYVDAVMTAAEMLSSQRRGMLAVFSRHTSLGDIIATGTKLNADLSSSLLFTIFSHDTPLHDGACIIQGAKIVAAGCILPPSDRYDIKKTFGTRHRAALGLSENSDSVVLVVSEETGAMSLAYDSSLHYDLTKKEITSVLKKLLGVTAEQNQPEDSK